MNFRKDKSGQTNPTVQMEPSTNGEGSVASILIRHYWTLQAEASSSSKQIQDPKCKEIFE